MTDSTPPGGLDSPPSTDTPQPLPPPTPALPSRGRQAPSTPAPAPRPARRRTRTETDGEPPGHRLPRLPTSTPPRRPSATSRQQPRTRNFSARSYIGRTPPRYTPKDTPAALRPVLPAFNSAFGEFAEPDAQNARQQTQRTPARLHHAHQWTGEPLHFQPAAISDEMTQYLYSIASTHFLSFFPR